MVSDQWPVGKAPGFHWQLTTGHFSYDQPPRRHHGIGRRHLAGRGGGRVVGERLLRQERHRPDHALGHQQVPRPLRRRVRPVRPDEVRRRGGPPLRGEAAAQDHGPLRPVRHGRLAVGREGRRHRLQAGGLLPLRRADRHRHRRHRDHRGAKQDPRGPRREPGQPLHRAAPDGQRRQRQRLDLVPPQRPQHLRLHRLRHRLQRHRRRGPAHPARPGRRDDRRRQRGGPLGAGPGDVRRRPRPVHPQRRPRARQPPLGQGPRRLRDERGGRRGHPRRVRAREEARRASTPSSSATA